MASEKIKSNQSRETPLLFHHSCIVLWKLLDLLPWWDYINTLQVGYTVGDMCSRHLLFITLQGINSVPSGLCHNSIKSFKLSNMFSEEIRMWPSLKNSKTSFFMEPTLTKCGLHKTSTMGSFPLMENLALMMPFCHWLSLDSLAFKSLPNELFPLRRVCRPVEALLPPRTLFHSLKTTWQVLSIYRAVFRKVPILFKLTFPLEL